MVQSKYLCARTIWRGYYHITKEMVIEDGLSLRDVARLEGVSSFKQAWSIGSPYKLLVRKETCCCAACLTRNFAACKIMVVPVLLIFA